MQTAWFWILFVLWTLYLVTEGFDFGVGMLLPILGRSEDDRRTMIQSIGPVWDGNEVWLVIAGAATFAAFPVWYATMFSGFYVALLLLLVLLITRIVSFEWRGKADSKAWRGFWTWVNAVASARHPAPLGHRALEPAPRCPRLVRSGVHRNVLGSVHSVHRLRGRGSRGALRVARCGLPRPAHERRPARPRGGNGDPTRGPCSPHRRRVSHLDARSSESRTTTRASSRGLSSSSWPPRPPSLRWS